jgi:hypothetical protein
MITTPFLNFSLPPKIRELQRLNKIWERWGKTVLRKKDHILQSAFLPILPILKWLFTKPTWRGIAFRAGRFGGYKGYWQRPIVGAYIGPVRMTLFWLLEGLATLAFSTLGFYAFAMLCIFISWLLGETSSSLSVPIQVLFHPLISGAGGLGNSMLSWATDPSTNSYWTYLWIFPSTFFMFLGNSTYVHWNEVLDAFLLTELTSGPWIAFVKVALHNFIYNGIMPCYSLIKGIFWSLIHWSPDFIHSRWITDLYISHPWIVQWLSDTHYLFNGITGHSQPIGMYECAATSDGHGYLPHPDDATYKGKAPLDPSNIEEDGERTPTGSPESIDSDELLNSEEFNPAWSDNKYFVAPDAESDAEFYTLSKSKSGPTPGAWMNIQVEPHSVPRRMLNIFYSHPSLWIAVGAGVIRGGLILYGLSHSSISV